MSALSVLRRLVGVAALAAAVLAGMTPAAADRAQPDVVGEEPVTWTPHILDGTVYAITSVGDVVVVGGAFSEVTDAAEAVRFRRRHLLAFHAADGTMSGFAPYLDGPVEALAPGPDNTVYIGGDFRTVNGVRQRGLAQLRLDTGALVPRFAAQAAGRVRTIARHGNTLYIGGSFGAVNGVPRAGIAELDATTGAVDPGFDAALRSDSGRVVVRELALAPDGRRLVAIGGFSYSHDRPRRQVVMLDTAGEGRSTLTGWYTHTYDRSCAPIFDHYVRGVDFAPDGGYFVVVTTGGRSSSDRMCDSAARFDTAGTGEHTARWVNHTGGHSLYSVGVTGAAVYVGGHQMWQDNPQGWKTAGPGAVPREGIAALNPTTGRALPWNPGRARGVGVQAFHATADGLYVGSDTTRLGGVYRARIGMFPLADG